MRFINQLPIKASLNSNNLYATYLDIQQAALTCNPKGKLAFLWIPEMS